VGLEVCLEGEESWPTVVGEKRCLVPRKKGNRFEKEWGYAGHRGFGSSSVRVNGS
jgi:hypothetical protein